MEAKRKNKQERSSYHADDKSQQGEDHNHYSKDEFSRISDEELDSINQLEGMSLNQKSIRKQELEEAEPKCSINISSIKNPNQLKEAFESECQKRKFEFKKRYEYYVKIKKGLKMLKAKIGNKSEQLEEICKSIDSKASRKTVKLEIEKDRHKYTICIIKEKKENDPSEPGIKYKMFKQKKPDNIESHDSSMASIKTLELVNSIENLKDKYKRLIQLKEINDEKLVKAKKRIENLRNKNGMELIEELGMLPHSKENDMKNLIERKREKAIKGAFNIPKIKSSNNRYKRNSETKHNISTVPEDEEECKSSDSIGISSASVLVCEDKQTENDKLTLTKDNLNKFSLKNDRANFQTSLVGSLMKSIVPPKTVQSYITPQSSMSCGKMIMMSGRLSFYGGTHSLYGNSISSIGSVVSSIGDNISKISGDVDESNFRMCSEASMIESKAIESLRSTFGRFSMN